MNPHVAIIIPAYNPGKPLTETVGQILERSDYPVILVDDGSNAECSSLFRSLASNPRVTLCQHATNRGKGAALKTAFNHALIAFPEIQAVVTADADGQHTVEDILNIALTAKKQATSLVLGTRRFGTGTPLRSWFGNTVSRWLYYLLLGIHVQDTQTGLRAIPKELMLRSLHIRSNRYEFETEQLALVQTMRVNIVEVPIQTVYENNNASSHFNPLLDSARIYFAVLRYALASLGTSAVDFCVFALLHSLSMPIVSANIGSRLIAMIVQYNLLNHFVFKTHSRRWKFIAFAAYVTATGTVSGLLQVELAQAIGTSALISKVIIECAIFIFNFLFLRNILFAKKHHESSD